MRPIQCLKWKLILVHRSSQFLIDSICVDAKWICLSFLNDKKIQYLNLTIKQDVVQLGDINSFLNLTSFWHQSVVLLSQINMTVESVPEIIVIVKSTIQFSIQRLRDKHLIINNKKSCIYMYMNIIKFWQLNLDCRKIYS